MMIDASRSDSAGGGSVAEEGVRRTVLSAEGISKQYGHVTALDSVDLSLAEGEIVALVGDNGAGKTTLVSILTGLIQPDAGELRLDSEPIWIDSPRRAQELGIATVFQDLALVNQRDVAANLFLGREPRRFGLVVDRRRMIREASAAIARLRVGLPNVRALASDLSGGQRQAVAVARAILRESRVLLLDEPTAALGVREARRVVEFVKELRADGRISILLISHNMDNVFELADRVVVFRQGKKVAERLVAETSMDEIVGLIVGGRFTGSSQ
ncbi:MAG: ribose transport system ATP-binding protein [Gaiellaceae bacterium]|jgi:ABC-type sugar transport system ATPase subunit|nr:ribose transport system ATP-binding protein [Gaiellaceae bacterium]